MKLMQLLHISILGNSTEYTTSYVFSIKSALVSNTKLKVNLKAFIKPYG